MLTIRTEQMKAMSDAVAGRFQGQMVAFLGQAFPQQTAGKSDAQLLATVLDAKQRAAAYGFRTRFEIQGFLSLIYALGSNFDEEGRFPWVNVLLTEAGVSAHERMVNAIERARIACEEGEA
jgi:hypothetical protein